MTLPQMGFCVGNIEHPLSCRRNRRFNGGDIRPARPSGGVNAFTVSGACPVHPVLDLVFETGTMPDMNLRSLLMKKAVLLAAVLTLLPSFSRTEEPAPPAGFRAIFNGKDLTGWYGWNPHTSAKLEGEKLAENLKSQRADFANHWSVDKGELVNSGTGPYATTEENFGDYELLLEYKTVAGADSGIYLRGMPQVQIWDSNQVFDPAKPDRRPHLGSGGLFNNTPKTLGRDPIAKVDKPFGQWNTFKIKQIGARTWVTLNNRLVVDGAPFENYPDKTLPFPATGPLMLQTHGGEIRWRNIFIREIGEGESKTFLEANPLLPNPTHYDVAYGPHPKQLIHFWQAESETPTPVLFFIHGGGWSGGGRLSGVTTLLPTLLKEGISVASVEYRFIAEATADGVTPPVKGPLHDAARALQFLRSKAAEWNIDKTRIGASGGSAGACSSLWLAFHDDLADPKSEDPVARESTRLLFAAVNGAQTTLDPAQMKEWTPNSRYGGHAFGFTGDPAKKLSPFDEFLAKRETILPWIAEYSPYALVSKDDPPVYLHYSAPPAVGQEQKDPTHTANFGVKLQEHCQANGLTCELFYPGAADSPHATILDYLLVRLKPGAGEGK
jgi:acetyl esterase/lipase